MAGASSPAPVPLTLGQTLGFSKHQLSQVFPLNC